MATIAVDFLRGPELSSKLIGWFGKGGDGFSHVAPVLADGRYCDARSDVIAGVPAGVQIRRPETELAVYRERWALDVEQSVYDAWEANLRARITTQYGKGDIVDFIFARPGHLAGHWICSAHAVDALEHVKLVPYQWVNGEPLLGNWAPHQFTPNDALLVHACVSFKKTDFWDTKAVV